MTIATTTAAARGITHVFRISGTPTALFMETVNPSTGASTAQTLTGSPSTNQTHIFRDASGRLFYAKGDATDINVATIRPLDLASELFELLFSSVVAGGLEIGQPGIG